MYPSVRVFKNATTASSSWFVGAGRLELSVTLLTAFFRAGYTVVRSSRFSMRSSTAEGVRSYGVRRPAAGVDLPLLQVLRRPFRLPPATSAGDPNPSYHLPLNS